MSEEIKGCPDADALDAAAKHFEWCATLADDLGHAARIREVANRMRFARAHDGDGWRDIVRSEIINTPETADFMAGVPIEAAHQRERWGSDHDAGKTPFDWFWLVGYLAQKAAASAVAGDTDKALHHTISTAGALANWHAALSGKTNAMRPGIAPPQSTFEQEHSK